MPIKQSAIKELRKIKKRVVVNARVLSAIDRLIRQARKAIAAKGVDAAKFIAAVQKSVDKAAARGIIKKNTAARIKSRLSERPHGQTK